MSNQVLQSLTYAVQVSDAEITVFVVVSFFVVGY
jgi:hypothetical protein